MHAYAHTNTNKQTHTHTLSHTHAYAHAHALHVWSLVLYTPIIHEEPWKNYGVATISKLLKIIGLFCSILDTLLLYTLYAAYSATLYTLYYLLLSTLYFTTLYSIN